MIEHMKKIKKKKGDKIMECSFCSEINNKEENNFFDIYLKEEFEKNGLDSRIVATTKKFVVMPMVGPLVPGYLLIVPKDHYLSIAQLPREQVEELKIIKEELKKVFKEYYGDCVFYEHGALSCSAKGGSCSDHAHLHIVAVDTDVKDKFDRYGYELRKIKDCSEITDQKQRNIPYLYYENQQGEMFVADAPVVESQFIRKLIAKDIDALDRALWNENIRKDWMIEIVKKLRPHFEQLKGNSIWE